MSILATINAFNKSIHESSARHHHQHLCSTTATLPKGRRCSSLPSKWGFGANYVHASASRKSKLSRNREKSKGQELQVDKVPSTSNGVEDQFTDQKPVGETCQTSDSNDESLAMDSGSSSTREAVLQACFVTCGVIFSLGMAIRQVSHVGFMEGWLIHDCSAEVSFSFEIWQLGLIVGLVLFISSCRYVLLNIWPDFANSSEVSNTQQLLPCFTHKQAVRKASANWVSFLITIKSFQILGPLIPLDYLVVAFLPGISEELLFRGALLPLLGLRWENALVVGAIFGILHLGSGRKYSFAVWATFVGICYSLSTIATSSVIVPITSHSLNNLVGALLWRFPFKLVNKT